MIQFCHEYNKKIPQLTRMSLNTGIGMVIHQMKESRDDFIVELLFEHWGKVGRHLSDGITGGKSNPRVLK